MRQTTIDIEDLSGIVKQDDLTGQFVVQGGTPVAAQLSLLDKLDSIGPAVVLNGFGLTFNEFFYTFALLQVKRQLTGLSTDQSVLVALRVLPHLDAGASDHDAAFGHDNPPGENTGLLLLVVPQSVSLDVHGFAAIRFFGMGRSGADTKRRDQKPEGR